MMNSIDSAGIHGNEQHLVCAEIKHALQVLIDPGQVVELRALDVSRPNYRVPHVESGYFDDMDTLAKAAQELEPYAKGIYFTPNPVNKALLSRSYNKVRPIISREPLTSDLDIIKRRWLLIDADPVRPAGISSSNYEHELAIQRVKEIRDYTDSLGWPEPILADSGNGAHLLYSIDLPANDGGLVSRILQALDLIYSDVDVVIDQKVFNPTRIWKLYGTISRKGDNTDERPHRRSHIISIPSDITPVPIKLLESLADTVPSTQPIVHKTSTKNSEFNMDEWIADYCPDIRGPIPWNGGRKWIFDECPWNSEHRNRSAYIIQFPNGALAAGCHHNGCLGKDWHSLRRLLEPTIRDNKVKTNVLSNTASATDKANDEKESKPSQSDKIVADIEISGIHLFQDQHGESYCRIPIDNHYEIRSCRSKHFKQWLRMYYWELNKKVPNSDAINSARDVLEAKAGFYGTKYELGNRVAHHNNEFWYDLADKECHSVRISEEGWEIISNPPILFRRHNHQLPQVFPKPDGKLSKLVEFVNLRNPNDGLLLQVYIVSCLIPDIGHPITLPYGPQGAAKSTLFRMCRRLVDPSSVELLSFPKDNAELIQQLSHHWMPMYDNITILPDWISDILCRTVTGEGFTKRELYSNDDDIIYQFRRCVGLNGINIVAPKPDLLDRCILFALEPISPEQRKSEIELQAEFNAIRPQLLGSVFDALSKAMAIRPTVKVSQLPRMADFTLWGCAIAEALGYSQADFLNAYCANINAKNDEVISGNPVAEAVAIFMENRNIWEGQPSGLLEALNKIALEHKIDTVARIWPKAAHILTRRLNEVRSNLSAVDISIDQSRRDGHRRYIKIQKAKKSSVTSITTVIDTTAAKSQGIAMNKTANDATESDNEVASCNIDATVESNDASDTGDAIYNTSLAKKPSREEKDTANQKRRLNAVLN